MWPSTVYSGSSAIGDGRIAIDRRSDDLARQVRDALIRLYDPVYLQTHRLAKALAQADPVVRPTQAGARLRQRLIEAIEALQPEKSGDDRAWRAHRIMQLRYIDALDAPEVQAQIGLAKTQYYREHERALAVVVEHFTEHALPEAAVALGRQERPSEGWGLRPGHNLPAATTSFIGRERE